MPHLVHTVSGKSVAEIDLNEQATQFHRVYRSIYWEKIDSDRLLLPMKNVVYSTFVLNGTVNKQNCRYWSTENPHWMMEAKTQYLEKVNVWAGIINSRIIGSYFFDSTLTGALLGFLAKFLSSRGMCGWIGIYASTPILVCTSGCISSPDRESETIKNPLPRPRLEQRSQRYRDWKDGALPTRLPVPHLGELTIKLTYTNSRTFSKSSSALLPYLRKGLSGSLKLLHSIPKAQDPMMSVVNRAKKVR
ncbi:hypothetical protein NQ318_004954 [Aromia moschata]|uniref:Uncharacterized protein n=1 Tax=Aromia moschata TaxID=1265417 RepID=A0AAV8XB81_9CUCU|nr:hypothetical protein NQ318_004954 [Aromia moschata]